MSLIVKFVTNMLSGFLFIYGIYIVVHGHLSPGGGFAGGVIIAGVFILRIIALGGNRETERKSVVLSSILEGAGGLMFMGIALAGLVLGGVFFLNIGLFPLGLPLHLYSAGLIPLCNIAIGIKVSAGLFSIFIALAGVRYWIED
jgi:multisubunit Na+/H+ antiporter MnhB subunit